MKSWWKWLLAAVVLAALVAVGVDLLRPRKPETWSARQITGETWNLADHLGKGPLMVVFFGLT